MKKTAWNDNWKISINHEEMRNVTIPHDAMQEMGRSAAASSGQAGAYFNSGIYHYEKTFVAPGEWMDKEVFLELEGVYPKGEVILNGRTLGFCTYGYLTWRFELKNIFYDRENKIEILVNHSDTPDSRWYSGGGLYRPVFLWIGAKKNIKPEELRIKTLEITPPTISVELLNPRTEDGISYEVKIFDEETQIYEGTMGIIELPDASLWEEESPRLYRCEVHMLENGTRIDNAEADFGIRMLTWSEQGFFVNGKNTLLKGGCIHHDNGILGAREYEESAFRKIKKLKEFGFNAVRSSHNPASNAILKACDQLGMYVIDEVWDMWFKAKSTFDYANCFMEYWKTDIQSVVSKDYNHPSVIMYSIGNEVTEPCKKQGIDLAANMVEVFHKQDETRPVTAGINITLLMLARLGIDLTKSDDSKKLAPKKEIDSTAFNEMMTNRGAQMSKVSANFIADKVSRKILDLLDIAGYNYASARYEKEGRKHPGRVIVGSETYPHELVQNWEQVEKYPYLIGDFMWTAWDYLGEAGIGAWTYPEDGKVGFEKPYPWLLADTGAFDILGNDNAEAGNAAVIWKKRAKPYIAVMPVNHSWDQVVKAMWRGTNALPYWSYQGCDGNETQVEVYSQGDSIELFINGKSLGTERLVDYKAVFHPKYEPGILKAVAYDRAGTVLGESMLESADEAARITVILENKLTSDDIYYLDISLTGENGRVECNADEMLSVHVTGGELLGFGSANPRTEGDFLSGNYKTYYGRSQAVVRKTGERTVVKVCGTGLAEVQIEF